MKLYIKEALKLRRITQKQISSYLKVPENTFSNRARSINEPDFEMIVKIAKYLNVTTDFLLMGSEISKYKTITDSDLAKIKYHHDEITKILEKY